MRQPHNYNYNYLLIQCEMTSILIVHNLFKIFGNRISTDDISKCDRKHTGKNKSEKAGYMEFLKVHHKTRCSVKFI